MYFCKIVNFFNVFYGFLEFFLSLYRGIKLPFKGLPQAFFLCAPQKKTQGHKNSRNRKLKKIIQNSSKNLWFPAFLAQILKDTFGKIAKSNSQGRKITHFFQINDVLKLKTKIFQRFPPKAQ